MPVERRNRVKPKSRAFDPIIGAEKGSRRSRTPAKVQQGFGQGVKAPKFALNIKRRFAFFLRWINVRLAPRVKLTYNFALRKDAPMSWKDVLAIVSDAEADAPAIALAEAVASQFDAHLTCAFLTALPDEPLAYEPTVVAGVWAELLGRARAQAEEAKRRVADKLKTLSRPCDLNSAEALSRDLGRVAAVHARYADVAVLTRPTEQSLGDGRAEIIEGVLFHSGRPALIAPPNWSGSSIGKRVVIAWDASREATRALSEAQPFLDRAEEAIVLTIDAKPKMFGHGDQPGLNIAAHLSRRGLKTTVRNADSLGKATAQTMLEQAAGLGADLLVMGAYTHSRLREMVFGGATRDLLRAASVPILMAH
jgi:nucleotide-binding universal stress UspA family protein